MVSHRDTTDVTSGVLHSPDGTPISWSREGLGPPLVMVDCVGASRATTPQRTLPGALAAHFTVYRYDRRGKGESGNTDPYAVEREFEDLTAVIELAGAEADVYGFSSGATLALLAAAAGVPVRRLALLEPPLSPTPDPDLTLRGEFLRRYEADPADARAWFLTHVNRVPAEVMVGWPPPSEEDLRNTRTNAHELTFLPGTTAEQFAQLTVPALVIASDHTPGPLPGWAKAVADAMPSGRFELLPGRWHGVADDELVEVVTRFLR